MVKAGWRFQWRDAAEASQPKQPDIITVSLSRSGFLSRENTGFSDYRNATLHSDVRKPFDPS